MPLRAGLCRAFWCHDPNSGAGSIRRGNLRLRSSIRALQWAHSREDPRRYRTDIRAIRNTEQSSMSAASARHSSRMQRIPPVTLSNMRGDLQHLGFPFHVSDFSISVCVISARASHRHRTVNVYSSIHVPPSMTQVLERTEAAARHVRHSKLPSRLFQRSTPVLSLARTERTMLGGALWI